MLIILACATAVTLYADYRESFRKGILAARRSRWQEVAAAMRDAIKEAPRDTDERINIAGFGDIVPYTPYYYLGLALYQTNDCPGALAAWQSSEQQGGLQRISGGARNDVAKFRKACEAKSASNTPTPTPTPPKPVPTGPDPAAVNAAVQAAEAAINRAQDSERAVSQLSSDALLNKVWKSEGGLGGAEQSARDTLGQARNALDAGRREPNLQRLQDAASLANTAAQRFDAIRQTAANRRAELAAPPIKEMPTAPTGRTTPPTPPIPPIPTPIPAPEKPVPTAKVEPPVTPAKPPAPFTAPRDLATAARLFFSARYQEAAESLGKLRYDSGPAAGHAALFRAATAYSLYLIGGERDATLAQTARQWVVETRRVAPALQPDPRAFSPRFVQFFTQTR